MSDMDWAEHIKMDYAKKLRKSPIKGKKLTWFIEDHAASVCPFGIQTPKKV